MNLLDSCLAKDLEKYLSNDKIKAKFYKFKSILNELQQTTKWVWMFRWRRAMVIVMNILRNIWKIINLIVNVILKVAL